MGIVARNLDRRPRDRHHGAPGTLRQDKASAVAVDLDALWRELGVVRRGRGVVLDNTAPAASLRKAITSP